MLKLKHIIIILITLFVVFTINCISNNYTYAASKTNISKAKVVFTKVPSKVYTYNGKARKPAIAIKIKGVTLKKGRDYTLSYKNNRNVGKATIIIKGKGKYNKTKSVTFKIRPKETSLFSLSARQNSIIVKYKKNTFQTKGYQIQYSTNSDFSSSKTKSVNISDNTKTKATISNLTYSKKYYIRIRTYKTVKGTKYYSKWSRKKSIVTEKQVEYPNYILIEPSGDIHLTVGDTYQLSVKTTPENVKNKSGIWKSSDESVATVDSNGKITALRNGFCNITFTTANGIQASRHIGVYYTILGTKEINKVIYNQNGIIITAKNFIYDMEADSSPMYFSVTNNSGSTIGVFVSNKPNYTSESDWGVTINGKQIKYNQMGSMWLNYDVVNDSIKNGYISFKQDYLRSNQIKQINTLSFYLIFTDENSTQKFSSELITINL